MEKKTKGSKRRGTKYPGLVREVHPKPRWEYIDFDYTDKLSEKEKEYLSNFNEEWLSGNFNHKGKKFHKTKADRKKCYDRNNARNRDIYSINRTHGWIVATEDLIDGLQNMKNPSDVEEAMVSILDLDKEVKKT
jgi:hypothetical protein